MEMDGNLTPTLRWKLSNSNFDKDTNSPELLIKSPKSYIKEFDSVKIPQYLAQIFEAKHTGSLSEEETISICEDLARVYGPNIISRIENIIPIIINYLASNSESVSIQRICSKVVLAIARYGIDPLTTEDKKREIINSICKPLSDSLLGSKESLASGAALCLQALITESNNWDYASDEIVNKICLNVAGALEEKPTQTSSHMSLVVALAKNNSLVIEPYAWSLIKSGLRILNIKATECDSKKKFSAIQMVNFLMKCLDSRSIMSELEIVIEEMEKCYSDADQVSSVKDAAFEVIQTARIIIWDNSSRHEKDLSSKSCSNIVTRARDRSPVSVSSLLENVHSCIEYESLAKSPMSPGQLSCNFDHTGRFAGRKLWKNNTWSMNGQLNDGLSNGMGLGCCDSKPKYEDFKEGVSNNGKHYLDSFSESARASGRYKATQSATPIPERLHSESNMNDIDILATPRKFVPSVEDPSNVNSNFSEKQSRRIRCRASRKLEQILAKEVNEICQNYKLNNDRNTESSKQASGSESVSSIDNGASNVETEDTHFSGLQPRVETQMLNVKDRSFVKKLFNLVFLLLLVLSITTLLVLWFDDQEVGSDLVPT